MSCAARPADIGLLGCVVATDGNPITRDVWLRISKDGKDGASLSCIRLAAARGDRFLTSNGRQAIALAGTPRRVRPLD